GKAEQHGQLSDADRAWAQQCVRVLTKGKARMQPPAPQPPPPQPPPGPPQPPAQPPPQPPAQPPAPPAGFPNAGNTGVPAGTALTAYTGPCVITANNTVIDAKVVDCNLDIKARDVVIKRSKINGHMGTVESTPFSYTLEDSEVDAGIGAWAAVGSTNMTILRSNIHGGTTSVYCFATCEVRD